jgi:hypothetical protein
MPASHEYIRGLRAGDISEDGLTPFLTRSTMITQKLSALGGLLLLLLALMTTQTVVGQVAVQTSAHPDFAVQTRQFTPGDVVYVRILPDAPEGVAIAGVRLMLVPRNGEERIALQPVRMEGGMIGARVLAERLLKVDAFWSVMAEVRYADGEITRGRSAFAIERPGAGDASLVALRGTVTASGTESFSIGRQEIRVTERTRIVTESGASFRPAALAGRDVAVRAVVHDDRVLEALHVLVFETKEVDADNRIEVTGQITVIGRGQITVGRTLFVVDGQTHIRTRDGRELRLGDLAVGMDVYVRGLKQNDGWVRAVGIVVLGQTPPPSVALEGRLERLGDAWYAVEGQRFRVTAETRLGGAIEADVAPDALPEGRRVSVWVMLGDDERPVARSIFFHGEPTTAYVEMTGKVTAVSTTAVEVAGRTFIVTDRTVIMGPDREPISLRELEVGAVVRIVGEFEGRALYALRIQVQPQMPLEGRLSGKISAIGDRRIEVAGVPFALVPETRVHGEPVVGAHATVAFRVGPNGGRIALDVFVHMRTVPATHLRGVLREIADGFVVVGGVRVAITPETVAVDEEGNRIRPASLEAGTFVHVRAFATATALVAEIIRVVRPVVVEGRLEDVAADYIVIGGERIRLTEETEVIGRDAQRLSLASLRSEMLVTVTGFQSMDSGTATFEAQTIEVVSDIRTTSIDEDFADLPGAIVLHPNYPNPFNPSTTIVLEVRESGLLGIDLAVYNVLGQRVRTLHTGALAPGVHRFAWDARDDSGATVASGTYIYRAFTGDRTVSGTMLFVK